MNELLLFSIVFFALIILVGAFLIDRKYMIRLRLTQKKNHWTRVKRGAGLTHLWVPKKDIRPSDDILYTLTTRLEEKRKRSRRDWRFSSQAWYRSWLRGRWFLVRRDGRDCYLREEHIRPDEMPREVYMTKVRPRRFDPKWRDAWDPFLSKTISS